MRIIALSSVLVVGALGHAAHADRVAAGEPVAVHTQRVAIAAGSAHAERSAAAAPERTTRERYLTAGDVTALVAPHASEIEHCYLGEIGELRRGSHLELTLAIDRDGALRSLQAAMPGLPPPAVRKIAACVRATLDGARFPERRSATTAVVPYYFQKTEAPNAGPQLSCWSPNGCH